MSDLTGFASKLAEQAARLAGVLTVFDTPEATTIAASHMASGIEIAQWFAGEALRLFGASAGDDDHNDAQLLLDWIINHWSEAAISIPDITNGGPNRVRTTTRVRELTKILVRHRRLFPLPGGAVIKGRRRQDAFRIVRREP